MSFTSWGGLPDSGQETHHIDWPDQVDSRYPQRGLFVGNGRSYGDVGLAESGTVTSCVGLDRVLGFDISRGVLRCEAGLTLGEILALVLPRGWCLPVMPGTQFVTVAGAIANDVHGKNHHQQGSFGRHTRGFTLCRSTGERQWCSSQQNPELYEFTIGGLGLTGLILDVELQLIPVSGTEMEVENLKFRGISEFLDLCQESDSSYEYTVAWIDCLHRELRGHFSRGNHAASDASGSFQGSLFDVPFAPPFSPVNRFTLGMFNSIYYHRQRSRKRSFRQGLQGFLFPLDRVGNWNRLYGSRGFRQYQCVVQEDAVEDLLNVIRRSGQGSFLAVLKMFGETSSPGRLSFPRPGVTLALDFPWRGARTVELFDELDRVVRASNGAIYPAKDAHMSAADFQRAYPAWERLEQLRDPALNSLFWQRVSGEVE